MKIETYDSLIDGMIDFSIVFLISSMAYVAFLATSLLIMLFLAWLAPGYVYMYTGLWLHVGLLFSSTMFGTFIYGLRKAKKIYEIKNFRDFWMAWATPVSIKRIKDFHNNKKNEVDEWCNENMSLYRCRHLNDGISYIFLKKSDAMAFKLQWYDK